LRQLFKFFLLFIHLATLFPAVSLSRIYEKPQISIIHFIANLHQGRGYRSPCSPTRVETKYSLIRQSVSSTWTSSTLHWLQLRPFSWLLRTGFKVCERFSILYAQCRPNFNSTLRLFHVMYVYFGLSRGLALSPFPSSRSAHRPINVLIVCRYILSLTMTQ
jgi:hypothetical protein